MVILKVTKKQGRTLSLINEILEKPQEVGGRGGGGYKLTPERCDASTSQG